MASPAPMSEAQLIANRENAQHSTGPRSIEGKSRTRLNGLRHGLTGQTVLLPEDDRAAYNQHCADLLHELTPAGPLETQIAQSAADDFWRLNRIKAIEDNIFALGIEAHAGEFSDDTLADNALAQAQAFLDNARQINLLSLYEARLNRTVAKKLAELAELQRIRKVAAATKGNGSGFSINSKPQPEGLYKDRKRPIPGCKAGVFACDFSESSLTAPPPYSGGSIGSASAGSVMKARRFIVSTAS